MFLYITILLAVVIGCQCFNDLDNFIHITHKSGGYHFAESYCRNQNKKLLRAESKEIRNYLRSKNINQYWIDAVFSNKLKRWVHRDKTRIRRSFWKRNEPKATAHYVVIINNKWVAVPETTSARVVCTNRYYHLRKASFYNSIRLCQNIGLHMARGDTVRSAKKVYHFAVSKRLSHYWLDANDEVNEGRWVHNDGSVVKHLPWAPGEPNGGRKQNCLIANFGEQHWKVDDQNCEVMEETICET